MANNDIYLDDHSVANHKSSTNTFSDEIAKTVMELLVGKCQPIDKLMRSMKDDIPEVLADKFSQMKVLYQMANMKFNKDGFLAAT